MGCFDASSRTKWGIFALLAIVSNATFLFSGPAYFGIIGTQAGEDSFNGCVHCVQDFGVEVLKTVNATDIADKLQKIHERNENNHPAHHHHHPPHHHHHHEQGQPDFEFDGHECITSNDIEGLKPDLDSLVIPDWKEECKEICTPLLKAVPLAVAFSSVLFFVGILSGICSIIPLCMLCCGSCKSEAQMVAPQWQHTYAAVPNARPVGTHVAGAPSPYAGAPSAAAPSEDAKMPLLTKNF